MSNFGEVVYGDFGKEDPGWREQGGGSLHAGPGRLDRRWRGCNVLTVPEEQHGSFPISERLTTMRDTPPRGVWALRSYAGEIDV